MSVLQYNLKQDTQTIPVLSFIFSLKTHKAKDCYPQCCTIAENIVNKLSLHVVVFKEKKIK